MGRIRKDAKVDGKTCWTLFDSGARNTYITRKAAQGLDLKPLPNPQATNLGGRSHKLTHACLLFAEVDGHPLQVHANVLDDIGPDEDGRPIEILFGALAMQQWGIDLKMQDEELDWSKYTTEFVEY